jgi:hypothetical protein
VLLKVAYVRISLSGPFIPAQDLIPALLVSLPVRHLEIECSVRRSCTSPRNPSQLFRATRAIATLSKLSPELETLKLGLVLHSRCSHEHFHPYDWHNIVCRSGFHGYTTLRNIM